MTNYGLTKEQIKKLHDDYGFIAENEILALKSENIDEMFDQIVQEYINCINKNNKLDNGGISIDYNSGILGVLCNAGAEAIKQYRDSLYKKFKSNIRDDDQYSEDIVKLLTKLYFLDPDNRDEYVYCLISIGFFKPLDPKLIAILRPAIKNLGNDAFCSKFAMYGNSLALNVLDFKFYNIKKSRMVPKEIANIFAFLERYRMDTQRKRKDKLTDILTSSYQDQNGQISKEKAEILQVLQQELLICYNQTPSKSFSLEFNKMPADLLQILINIYNGETDTADLDDNANYESVYDSLENKNYLAAFKLTQQPDYKFRNPSIYILLARIVLENVTALLTREISDNGITQTNIQEIKKMIRVFLLSLNRIEYEENVISIIDQTVDGQIDKSAILRLISRLYYNGNYDFKNVKIPGGNEMCQFAENAFTQGDYETATYYYARGLDLLGNYIENYQELKDKYKQSFDNFKAGRKKFY